MVTIVHGYGQENRVVAVYGTGGFVGELNLLTGSPAYRSVVVRHAGEVIQVPAARLREMLANDEELSNLILRAFISRRSILIEIGAGVKVVGSRCSRDAPRMREFLARKRMPHQWMDVESDEEAEQLLRALGVMEAETPVVIASRGVLAEQLDPQH